MQTSLRPGRTVAVLLALVVGCFALAPAMRDVGYFLCMGLTVED